MYKRLAFGIATGSLVAFATLVFLAGHRPESAHGKAPAILIILLKGTAIAIPKSGVAGASFQDAELLLAGGVLGRLRRLDCRSGGNSGSFRLGAGSRGTN